jgi:hypothetical protein
MLENSMGATLLVACAGKSAGGSAARGGSSFSARDPLAAISTSVPLDASKVLAAGRAQDGSLYVVYNPDRLFVGSGSNLVERVVIGSGESGSQTDLDYTDDDGMQVTVEVVSDGNGTHMTVARGMQKSKGIDSGTSGLAAVKDRSRGSLETSRRPLASFRLDRLTLPQQRRRSHRRARARRIRRRSDSGQYTRRCPAVEAR